jgi:hypothetical protein
MYIPKKRDEAMFLDSDWYFTGKPCRKGHVAPRVTATTRCKGCINLATARLRKTNGFVPLLK